MLLERERFINIGYNVDFFYTEHSSEIITISACYAVSRHLDISLKYQGTTKLYREVLDRFNAKLVCALQPAVHRSP